MEFELEKLRIAVAADKLQKWMDFLSTGAVLATVTFCCWIVFSSLVQMTQSNADTVSALAELVGALNLAEITSLLVGLGGTGYGYLERRGRKRAYERLDKLQKQVEGQDPYRGSSHLTTRGETPRKRRA